MNQNPQKIQDLIVELAKNLDIEPAQFSGKDSQIHWKISSSHELFFRTLDQDLTLSCTIGELPGRNKEDFYLLLMRANFMGQGTGGNILGMDKEEKYLTLSSIIPYDVDAKRFKEIVEDFVNFVDYWREQLAQHVAQASGPFG